MLDYGQVFSAALMFAGVLGNFLFALWPLLFLSLLLRSRWPVRALPFVALALWGLFLAGRLIGLAFNYQTQSFLIPEPLNSVLFGVTGVGIVVMIFIMRAWGRRQQAAQVTTAQRNLRFRQFTDVSPAAFEQAVADLFRKRGFAVRITGRTGDGGVDLELSKDNVRAIVQCKRYTSQAVDVATVRDFYGALTARGASHGYFVTTSFFTKPAVKFSQYKPLTLIDRTELEKWLTEANTPAPAPVAPATRAAAAPASFAPVVGQAAPRPRPRRVLGLTPAQLAILCGLAVMMLCVLVVLAVVLLNLPATSGAPVAQAAPSTATVPAPTPLPTLPLLSKDSALRVKECPPSGSRAWQSIYPGQPTTLTPPAGATCGGFSFKVSAGEQPVIVFNNERYTDLGSCLSGCQVYVQAGQMSIDVQGLTKPGATWSVQYYWNGPAAGAPASRIPAPPPDYYTKIWGIELQSIGLGLCLAVPLTLLVLGVAAFRLFMRGLFRRR